MPEITIESLAAHSHRRERELRLSTVELPWLRVAGSLLLTAGVLLHNRYLLPEAPARGWAAAGLVLGVYALLTWLLLIAFQRRQPPRDLTLATLAGDLLVWTFAIYCSGGEQSWLFFILLMRVADQTQTSFRRAFAFALAAPVCYGGMLTWIALVDGREVLTGGEVAKVVFLLLGGLYMSLAARTAERRRAQLKDVVRIARDLIHRLEAAHAKAEEASAAKSEFVANMSHEMRTPLQAVIGMLVLAIEDEPSPETLRRLVTARQSAESLLSMIDDVLDFARIEARSLQLEPVYFSLRQLLDDTLKAVGVIAASRNLVLSCAIHQDVPETVWADPARLRQILVNLLGNAIKFTHEGEIGVQVVRDRDRVRFTVRDTGVGIAPSVHARIFEPFVQGDSSHARAHGGAGLGLSIVTRLLEAMGGTVHLTSEEGAGSVFTFAIPLPADAAAAGPERQAWEAELHGKAILVIEPAAMSRAAICETLRSRGVFASAFASAEEAPAGRFACAITSDAAVGVTPRIMITSPLDPSSHPHQVTRPVGERELLDAVGAALQIAPARADYSRKVTPAAGSSLRVLIVDDSAVNLEVVSEMVRRLGHRVEVAATGEEALAMLSARSYDVVFMDVQLPGMDGLEVTRRFRDSGGRIPVLALTAHTSALDRDRCLAAGMNGFLTKPIDSTRLAAALLPLNRRESVSAAVGGDLALLARVRTAFERQTPALLGAMREAIAAGDSEALARHAHKLKGSLSYFPGGNGASLALEVEEAARAGDLARAAGMLPDLEQAIDALDRALAAELA